MTVDHLSSITDIQVHTSINKRYEKLYNFSFDMQALLDFQGRFLSANQAFIGLLQWDLASLEGSTFWDLLVPNNGFDPTEYEKMLSKGHPVILAANQIRCKDGSTRSIRWTTYPDLELQAITLIIQEENQKETNYELFKLAVDASPTVLFIMKDEKIRYANQLTEQTFGYNQEEIVGNSVEMLIPPHLREKHRKQQKAYNQQPYLRLMGSGIELLGQRKDGMEFPVDVGLNPVETPDGLIVICSVIDLTRRKAVELQIAARIQQLELEISLLDRLASTDPLTSINNRRALLNQLELNYRIAQKENHPISFLMIDVDNFKNFNDSHGHIAGDRVLQILAEVLTKSTRRTEFIARYGGEEFAAIIPMADTRDALLMAERLRNMVEEYDWPLEKITVSVGAASVFPRSGNSIDPHDLSDLIQRADQALYVSKKSGKNKVTHYNNIGS